jgi:hypothetical protein
MPITSVVQILTASIAPVIVISSIGLLLLSITNRYGRGCHRLTTVHENSGALRVFDVNQESNQHEKYANELQPLALKELGLNVERPGAPGLAMSETWGF